MATSRSSTPTFTGGTSPPISGFITNKNAVAGAKVAPSDPLFEIVDLSRVWVLADVYENELPRLRLGQEAKLTLSYWPGRSWVGRIRYILPTVDEKTRTVKVRLEVDNPKNELKPEMFGDVVISTAPHTGLVLVPRTHAGTGPVRHRRRARASTTPGPWA